MPSYQKTLKSILDSDLCVGCGLCQGVSDGQVKMTFNNEGFLRPDKVVATEEEAKQVVNACPGYRLELPSTTIPVDKVWGPLVKCRTGHAFNQKLRFSGSSGGSLSALVASLIDNGMADNVIQITADRDRPIYNKLITNISFEAIKEAAGSRYCPSAPLAALPDMLHQNARSILVGKPCDIAGARQYIEQHPEYKDQVVIMVSFMCGGMPSIKGTKEILKQLNVDENALVSFRYRGEGWPGQVQAETEDGKISTMSYDRSWGEILRNYTQFRCKICPDAVGQFADVVFADAWGIDEEGRPSFEEEKGRSMILTRTLLGEEACEMAINTKAIIVEKIEIDMMNKMQPYHVIRKNLVLSRMIALKIMGRNIPVHKNLFVLRAAIQAGLWPNVKSILGTLRRIILKIL